MGQGLQQERPAQGHLSQVAQAQGLQEDGGGHWGHWGTQRLLSRRVPDHSGRSGAATVEGKDAGGRAPLEAAARVQAKPQEPELGLGTKTSLVNTARERSLHLTY